VELNMDREALFQVVKRVLMEQFEIDEQRVTVNTRLYDELDIDSIDAVDLLVRIKELTGKKILPEDFQEVHTIGDVLSRLTSV